MTVSWLQNVTHACFGLSYLLAWLLEWPAWLRPSWSRRCHWAAVGFGLVGLVAHTLFLLVHHPTPAVPDGSLLLLAWVLALFYLYGTVHRAGRAWALFLLPLIIALVGLSLILGRLEPTTWPAQVPLWIGGQRFWGALHGTLILLASVGISVSFVASLMYLLQARRLRRKIDPGRVLPLLSLERLETLNRRAIALAFPLLSAGLLLGLVLWHTDHGGWENWLSVKVLSTGGLWLVFGVLVYLRYGTHVPPRRLAWLSIAAFALLLVALMAAHPFAAAGGSV